MANLKDIRIRIQSVRSTRKITSAMKMVSAAKLRKAQDAIMRMRPYANKLNEILAGISGSVSADENPYARMNKIEKVLLVVISSNSSLCGAFNSNVVKKAKEIAFETYPEVTKNNNLDVFIIGKKGGAGLKGLFTVIDTKNELFENLVFENVADVAQLIMDKFTNGDYDRIDLVYNQFKNAAVQILTQEQFLPIELLEEEGNTNSDYIFEPSKEFIVEQLIPKSLKIQFYKALLDSFASEHGARMTAMHKATDNASDLIKDLNLDYNKARQAAITNEILEIVAGAEALKG